MRCLHPVQAHEKFLASGVYRFFKDGQALEKQEAWALHEHRDGGRMARVDHDAWRAEGKSILLEALLGADGGLMRLDLRYENARFEGGVKSLRATYQFDESVIQVGYNMNGAAREFTEVELPANTLIDIPLLIFRGAAVQAMAAARHTPRPIFVPMYEHAQLFPGAWRQSGARVDYAGQDTLLLGKREIETRRYTYRDQALAYWIDRHGVVVKRVNAFRQREFVVMIRDYAMPSA